MTKPTILTVDDDAAVSAAIARDLRARYGADYRIVAATSGAQGVQIATELCLKDRQLALVAADQRMPSMTGIQMLGEIRGISPESKLLLLTAYADTDVAIRAINDIGLDHYLLKPWDPPAERLYPVIDELLGDWRATHPDDEGAVRVVGHRWSERAHEIKTFLARNYVPYRWLDVDRDEEATKLVDLAGAAVADLPLVLVPDGQTLRAPSTLDLANALGLKTAADTKLYDLCIVGSGPAGLAAAVYAASEGLRTVVVERHSPGGQAGQSAAIENYLGFPKGLSGNELTQRAVAQARRFGAEMVLARDVVGFETRGPVRVVHLDGSPDGSPTGASVEAKSVLIATGCSYRKLQAAGVEELTGRGIYYGATASEAPQTAGDEVYVVGAANSAGQAALNFAKHASRVVIVARCDSLAESMSAYLVERITAADNIVVRLHSDVAAARGEGHLESLDVCDRDTGMVETVTANWLFIFIGAAPYTDWLSHAIACDDKGFVVTGPDLHAHAGSAVAGSNATWSLSRPPFALETSVPGVFAAGDVRLDSMKRVASAVGEGAMAVYLVHRYLATV
jgi:thioredoxin reductase (NADPH)